MHGLRAGRDAAERKPHGPGKNLPLISIFSMIHDKRGFSTSAYPDNADQTRGMVTLGALHGSPVRRRLNSVPTVHQSSVGSGSR